MLRIALVAPLVSAIVEPYLGGSQALIADLAAELAMRGHAVTLFAADGSRVAGVEVVPLGIDAGSLRPSNFMAADVRDPALAERERVAFLRVAYEIRRRVDELDVVHNHAFDAPAFELLGSSHRSVVHTLHLPPVKNDVVHAARAASTGAAMVTVSNAMAAAWKSALGSTSIIRNGVPLSRIPFSPAGAASWLFVGRITPEKGLEDALTAAEQAGRRLRVIGGVYDPAYHAALWNRVERHDAVGPLPRARVFEEMASASCLLMPAKWDEPFGLTAVEAMATGTPVAAYARGALPEVIRDGVSGLVVPPDDVDALRRAALRCAELDRAACRAWVESELTLQRMVDDYVDLYRKVA